MELYFIGCTKGTTVQHKIRNMSISVLSEEIGIRQKERLTMKRFTPDIDTP